MRSPPVCGPCWTARPASAGSTAMDRTPATPAPEPSSLPDWLSALADGQLAGDDLQQALDALGLEPAAQAHRAHWHTVHLIGEVLRHGPAPVTPHDELFLARLRVRLQAEPAARLPDPAREPDAAALADSAVGSDAPGKVANYPYSTGVNARFDTKKPAANDPGFRWRLAGLASVAAVALIGWSVGPGGWGGAGT
ncbi:MAG: hypothetical protein FGM55_16815, partial [Rhodoferax sp.]|nr:hypothetical protein [Rhodoferax sp.]